MLSVRQKSYLLLAGICMILYGFSVPYSIVHEPRFAGNNDFKAHAHFMLAYADAFVSGQWIPRTVTSATIFNDAALPVADAPTFQYYGFFEGLLALPFHLLGFKPALAAVSAVILARIIGAIAMYEACLLFGATRAVAILANLSFLISPYVISCFYSRGALAESIAHSLMPLIYYGFALSWREKYQRSILIYFAAFAALSLCHNIFLLYGAILHLILLFSSFKWRVIVAGGVGSFLGVLITSWQWLPMQQTVGETAFGRMLSWKIPDVIETETHSASWSGALGFPQLFSTSWDSQVYSHYFTIGFWSLPLIALLIFVPKEKRRLAFSIITAGIGFLALTFAPMSTYLFQNWLPGFFNVVQNSYRLISFVSLASAFALAVAFPLIKTRAVWLFALLVVVSQVPVISNYTTLVRQEVVSVDAIRGAPINAYYSTPPTHRRIRDLTGILDTSNLFSVSSPNIREFSLRLVGYRSASINPVVVYLEEIIADTPERMQRVTQKIEIATSFDISFQPVAVPTEMSLFRLVAVDAVTGVPAQIVPQGFFLYEGKKSRYVVAEDVLIKNSRGYSREFQVNPSAVKDRETMKIDGDWIVELPMTYSRLFRAYQNDELLESSVDFNHRMRVKVSTLQSPVIVKYRLDADAIWLTFSGFLGLILVLTWNRFVFPQKYRLSRVI